MTRLSALSPDGYDREPTAEDLRSWLHAHPDVAVEVARELLVAGPWPPAEDRSGSWRCHLGLDGNPLGFADVQRWRACAESGACSSIEEGRAACDASLVAQGFALAGGGS